ncbi:MAG TPA: hypothetical protein VG602_07645 [Actinomycetota bacterium]|nr:hypothetical protein [Actinomycetota bacterium]
MRSRRFIPLVAIAASLSLMSEGAIAAEFSPAITFTLSDLKTEANPTLQIRLTQDAAEEELQTVQLEVPAGFKLPTDDQIPNDTRLGTGEITIQVGPGCRPGGPPGFYGPANVPVNIVEKDRRADEIADGGVAVWFVDLEPVTRVRLLVKGSSTAGYTLTGNVPPNDNTCPPFTFSATINKTAGTVPIITNPSTGGDYTLGATFTGLQGSTSQVKQVVKIEGAGGGTTTTTGKLTKAEKKKCLKKKSKKARKACIKKQRRD